MPDHLGLVYAVGSDKDTGKYKHVLVSRPSGGQSPCGWIPWSNKDRYPGEIMWEEDIDPDPAGVQEAIRTGKISPTTLRKMVNSDNGVRMKSSSLRGIYVLTLVGQIEFYKLLPFTDLFLGSFIFSRSICGTNK